MALKNRRLKRPSFAYYHNIRENGKKSKQRTVRVKNPFLKKHRRIRHVVEEYVCSEPPTKKKRGGRQRGYGPNFLKSYF